MLNFIIMMGISENLQALLFYGMIENDANCIQNIFFKI